MKKRNIFLSLLFALAICTDVFAWGSATGDGSRYAQLQETAVFFNNSGGTLSAGDVVILDTSGTGVSAGSTLGAYVTTVDGADSVLVVGVVNSTSVADQTPVSVVTKGPIDTLCHDLTDAVTVDTAVGTTAANEAGACGGGTNLGIALEAGDGGDYDYLYIWVSPTGAD